MHIPYVQISKTLITIALVYNVVTLYTPILSEQLYFYVDILLMFSL